MSGCQQPRLREHRVRDDGGVRRERAVVSRHDQPRRLEPPGLAQADEQTRELAVGGGEGLRDLGPVGPVRREGTRGPAERQQQELR